MGAFNDVDPGFCLHLVQERLFVRAVIGDTRPYVNLCGFLVHGSIPQLHLSQASDDGRSRTIAAVEEADDFRGLVFVPCELTFSPIEPYQAPGTPDTDVVHNLLAAHD